VLNNIRISNISQTTKTQLSSWKICFYLTSFPRNPQNRDWNCSDAHFVTNSSLSANDCEKGRLL